MSRLVGLTGGIACGKSTVARMLSARGAAVVDADRAARAVVRPGQPTLDAIVEHFGPGVLSPQGTLNRAAMRKLIAEDPEARGALEALTHPAIRLWVAERIAGHVRAGAEVVVVEAALLVETGSYAMYPDLVVVSCTPERQIERMIARDGVSEDHARAMLAAQLPIEEKEAVATHIVRNNGGRDELEREVDLLWRRLSPSAG